MKHITNKTILKQGDKTYKPIEINGVIYWVDDKEELISENDYSVMHRLSDNKPYINSASHYKANKKEKGKIIAQSQPKLDGIPVVSLDMHFEFITKEKAKTYCKEITDPAKVWFWKKGYKAGVTTSPNQYTQADIEKAIELAREEALRVPDGALDPRPVTMSKYNNSEIFEQINSISVIEIDEQFNVLIYE